MESAMHSRNCQFFDSLGLFAGGGDLRIALGHLIQLAAESANSDAASIYLLDSQENVLKPLVTYGLPEAYVAACGNVKVGDQCCGRAFLHRKPWVVSDMLTDPLFASAREAALLSPVRAAFSVPIIDQNGPCLGSLACHYSKPYTPTSEDLDRNKLWAAMIAHTVSSYQSSRLIPRPGQGAIPA
jgi:GAF domain-containing protein